jgi:nucleotide-binding universal stress UspA family protein
LIEIVLLLRAATIIKVGVGALGARLGGLRPWEAVLVGLGLNLKGGTDVIVAILGVQLGLLSVRLYTLYTVVAILTVLASPPLVTLLERHVPPSADEMARLNREEAKRRAYLPHLERILIPIAADLRSDGAAVLVRQIAQVKHFENEICDITRLVVGSTSPSSHEMAPAISRVEAHLNATEQGETAEITRRHVQSEDALPTILAATEDHDLIAIGANAPTPDQPFTLGRLQDQIIHRADSDVLVTVAASRYSAETPQSPVAPRKLRRFVPGRRSLRTPGGGRILVAVNGFEHSLAAGDVAAYLAKATNAELILFTSVRPRLDGMFWRERTHRGLLQSGYQLLHELGFRVGRLNVRTRERAVLGDDPGAAIVRELQRQPYDLVVLGAMDRSTDDHLYLGSPIETVLQRGNTPAVVLVTHE